MKTPLLLKVLLSMMLVCLTAQIAQAACIASFNRSINGLTVTFSNTSTSGNSTTNGLKYKWTFGDGTTSDLKNPVKTYTTGGNKVVTLIISDSLQGCLSSKTDTIMLWVSPSCKASFTRVISGLTVSFNNTSVNVNGTLTGLRYAWHFGDGTVSDTKNPVKTYTSTGVKIVTLTISDSLQGCLSSKTDTIVLSSSTPCNASFTRVVTGFTVTFNNTSVNTNGSVNGLKYKWSFGDGTTSDTKNPVKTYTTPGVKVVTLNISDSLQGCYSSKTDTIVLSCNASFTRVINGLTVTFNNTSVGANGTRYSWNFGDGTTSDAKNPVKTYTNGGIKIVHLIIYDSLQGCSSSKMDSFSLSTNAPCSASFTRVINGLTVTFNNTSVNANGSVNGLKYKWAFGDGTTSDTKNPVKTYTTPGVKIVTLTISDSLLGCSSTKKDTIVLSSNTTCVASFTRIINGLTVTFNNTSVSGSAAGIRYKWSFGDGTSSDTKNPVKTYTSAGIKIVKLIISDSLSGCSASKIDTIVLSPNTPCVASFTRVINGLTVTFNNTSISGSATIRYKWSFGDGTSSDTKNPVKTYTSPGVKIVKLTIFDSLSGCSASRIDTIVLSPNTPCAASFTKMVNGFVVTFKNTSFNVNGTLTGLKYKWTFGDGTVSDTKNPIKTYTSSGVKIITLSISDSARGCSSSFTDTVLLSLPAPHCQARFTIATDTANRFRFFILNTSTIRPGTTFLWNFGDGTTSTLRIPKHTYANFGAYIVCLTISDSICTSTFCDTIGMDSNGVLLKQGAFGFETLDFTTVNASTGTKEQTSATEYTIYPNPSNGIVYIDYTAETNSSVSIRITDITGKVVQSKTVAGQHGKHAETMDISDLQPAIYFMMIESNGGLKTYKMIKN